MSNQYLVGDIVILTERYGGFEPGTVHEIITVIPHDEASVGYFEQTVQDARFAHNNALLGLRPLGGGSVFSVFAGRTKPRPAFQAGDFVELLEEYGATGKPGDLALVLEDVQQAEGIGCVGSGEKLVHVMLNKDEQTLALFAKRLTFSSLPFADNEDEVDALPVGTEIDVAGAVYTRLEGGDWKTHDPTRLTYASSEDLVYLAYDLEVEPTATVLNPSILDIAKAFVRPADRRAQQQPVIEELQAYPLGTVLTDADGDTWTKFAEGWRVQIKGDPEYGSLAINDIVADYAPFTLVTEAQPNLGLATTRELLDELSARIEVHGPGLDYRTVDHS